MTNAMLNTQLYQKMYVEQEQYRTYLLTLTPAQILDHATEYICRENILMAMENNDLNNARAKALLISSPLLQTSTTNMQAGSMADSKKKFGTQLKPVPVRCYGQNLLQHRDPKGRRQNVIHSTRNH